jgi:hypothetical protein
MPRGLVATLKSLPRRAAKEGLRRTGYDVIARTHEFANLSAGDVLFVDTTHTVKTGGDVPRIVLEIFPTAR